MSSIPLNQNQLTRASALSVQLRLPLVSVGTACSILGCSAEAVVKKIESGELEFAFDICCGASGLQPNIRILARCVTEYQNRNPELKRSASREVNLTEVIDSILPKKTLLRSSELSCLLNCSLDTVANLAKAGHISRHKGAGFSYLVSRESAAVFLKHRRIL